MGPKFEWQTLAKTFVTDGLDPTSLSTDDIVHAVDSGKLVTWERRNRYKFLDPDVLTGSRVVGLGRGLRLVTPLGHFQHPGHAAAEMRRILEDPGYGASLRNRSVETGLSSFVFDNSLRGWHSPAISWPLRITGNSNALKILENSSSVQRGLVELVSPERAGALAGNTPYVFADLVTFDEPSFRGDALGLRFVPYGRPPSPLPDHLQFSRLRGIEPTVFLRPGRLRPDEAFTQFIYELSHNEPIDVAAWQSARNMYVSGEESPLVVASREFLHRARVSDTIPALRSRLRQLGDAIVPVSAADINRLGARHFKPGARPRATVLANLLEDPEVSWLHESGASEGIIALKKGVEALEGQQGAQSQPVSLASQPASSPPPPRYTDLRILDAKNVPLKSQPLLKQGQQYTLDVAIRSDRIGLTRKRTDQTPVKVPGQTGKVTLWVVVSDETDGDETVDGKLFKFEQRIASLRLPPEGNSEDSCKFPFSALLEPYRRGRTSSGAIVPRLGVRIYHKLNLIDHIQVNLLFEPSRGAKKPGIEVVFKHLEPSRGIEPINPSAAERAVTISVSKAADKADFYTFAFIAGNGAGTGAPHLSGVKKLPETQLNSWVSDFRSILLDTIFGPSFGQLTLPSMESEDLINSLSRLGTQIASRMFDYGQPNSDFHRLGEMVREVLPEAAIVQISLTKGAEDFVFPWQILTLADYTDGDQAADPKNLWGYRFVIEVKRCGDGADHRPASTRATNGARITYGRWNFANEPQHFQKLQTLVNGSNNAVQLLQPIVEARTEMLEALKRGGGELFYVYAHGYSAAPGTPSLVEFRNSAAAQIKALDNRIKAHEGLYSTEQLEAWKGVHEQFLKATARNADSSLTLKNSDVSLTFLLAAVKDGKLRLSDAPIIFLNTCDSAQVWNAIDDSFVSVFLTNGARAVLGTESTIPISLADEFGYTVLKSMIGGSPVGQAVLGARRELLNAHQNALGLCYCIYGDAEARLLSTTAN